MNKLIEEMKQDVERLVEGRATVDETKAKMILLFWTAWNIGADAESHWAGID